MHLDFERPRHRVDEARVAHRQVGDVARAGKKIREEFARGLMIDEDEQRHDQREIDEIRWLQPRESPQIVRAEAPGRPAFQKMRRKRQRENETADDEKKLDA